MSIENSDPSLANITASACPHCGVENNHTRGELPEYCGNCRALWSAPPSFPYPRKKHSHRCLRCGQAGYCYKKRCQKPQRIESCMWCR